LPVASTATKQQFSRPIASGQTEVYVQPMTGTADAVQAAQWMFSKFSDPSIRAWQVAPNPQAGMREIAWVQQQRDELSRLYPHQWVAILGQEVITIGASFAEVHKTLVRRGIRDALIHHVPVNSSQWDNLIA